METEQELSKRYEAVLSPAQIDAVREIVKEEIKSAPTIKINIGKLIDGVEINGIQELEEQIIEALSRVVSAATFGQGQVQLGGENQNQGPDCHEQR